jgi:hypothetical protein
MLAQFLVCQSKWPGHYQSTADVVGLWACFDSMANGWKC